MFNFLKKIAGGGKEGSCGKSACGSSAPKMEGSCSTDKSHKAAGSCGSSQPQSSCGSSQGKTGSCH